MAWLPIALTVPQYEDGNGDPASGYVLKAYEAGTSTNTNFATDSTGGTQVSSIALNANGFPEVSGNVVIPHIDRSYKLALYPTQAAADSDTGAVWTIDDLTQSDNKGIVVGVNSQSVTYAQVGDDDGKVILFTGAGGVDFDLLAVATATEGFTNVVENNTSGNVTIDPDGSELINGAATFVLASGHSCIIACTGTAWRAFNMLSPTSAITFTANNTFSGNDTHSGNPTFSGNPDFTGNVKANGTLLDDGQAMVAAAGGSTTTGWVPRGHLAGLVFTNGTDADHDIDIPVGECADSANAKILKLTSALTKQIDATWAAGTNQGGFMPAGVVQADTWYHVHLIRKDSDGSIDAGFDTSLTAANIPTGYTAYRRIGSVLTDSSSNIIGFIRNGFKWIWKTPIQTYNAAVPNATDNTVTTQVPLGVVALAHLHVALERTGAGESGIYLRSPNATSIAGSTSAMPLYSAHADFDSAGSFISQVDVETDTNSQFIARTDSGTFTLRIGCIGYTDLIGTRD